jgi:hypothetical protein
VAVITIVNIIPKSLSNETHQDSEPNLTINPARPRQLCATAFTPNPAGGPNAPVYVSSDGGTTWSLNAIVPGGSAQFGTGDITVRFATSSSELYAGDLRGDGFLQLNALRTNAFLTPTTMSILESRGNIDQPWVQAATVSTAPDTGKDRLYVGNNDFSAPNRQTATIDVTKNALAPAPTFTSVRVEKRTTGGQDGPQVRMTVHPDGTVYAAFYGWRGSVSGKIVSDVVVVRDDTWGTGTNPFTALVDPGDNIPGVRVSQGSTFVFGALLGQQRTGGDLSIVVDPTNSKTVYIAFADLQPAGYTLHLRRSTNRGKTWTGDVLTIPNATNPAVAISTSGKIAFLYQQVTGLSTTPHWETHVQESGDGITWRDLVLAKTPAGQPPVQFQPYIGDYVYMTANGVEFYGIFCASNTPDLANFPQGVTYQRNANFTTHTLLGVDNATPVTPSIDPFFFKIVPT